MSAPYDVVEKSISELQADMTAGRVSSVHLVEAYISRIAAYDRAGPHINAVLHLNPDAENLARALDEERARSGARGPLHGIPVLLKDNFETRDMPTTGASLGLIGARPARDAFQVAKLRAAGAVLLGKVNLHELALGLTTHSSLGGQTLSPYDLTRGPGGSSGGSGAAAAASFAAFTMGSDTSGSIRVPCSHNSLVGLRPSAGLASRAGVIPFSHTQDTAGPMTRTVQDLALVLDATVGIDPGDPITAQCLGRVPPTYTSALKAEALKGARIGVLGQLFGETPEDEEVGSIVRSALDEMRALGAFIVDVGISDLTDQLSASTVMAQEIKFCLGDYLSTHPESWAKSVEELLAAGLLSTTVEAFFVNVFRIAEQSDEYLESEDYTRRLAARETLAASLNRLMDENRLDVLAYPVTRRIAPTIGGNQIGSNASLAAQSGFPALTVPAGFTTGGFPVGIELIGRAFAEPTLLGLAYSFEQATHHRRPPTLGPANAGDASARAASLPSAGIAGVRAHLLSPGKISGSALAAGHNATPSCDLPYEAAVVWTFDPGSRELVYTISLQSATPAPGITGIYLHHRIAGVNGGIAHVLARDVVHDLNGKVVLTEAQARDLTAGLLYVSVVSKESPLLSARADIVSAAENTGRHN